MTADPALDADVAVQLRDSWEASQNLHKRGREQRFAVMLDFVEAATGASRRVLDLAAGPGSLTRRVRHRFPGAAITAVDVDPLLLILAENVFGDDPYVTVVERNLHDPDWPVGLDGPYDVVLTATALHWLDDDDLAGVLADIHGLLRPGGWYLNADHLLGDDRAVTDVLEREHRAHLDRHRRAGVEDSDAWYARAYADRPQLLARRERSFAHMTGEHPQTLSAHRTMLADAGFGHIEEIWRYGTNAVVVAQAGDAAGVSGAAGWS